MRRGGDHYAALVFALVIFWATFCASLGTDASETSDLQIDSQNSLRGYNEKIGHTLLELRHLLKSLFSDWNLGESEGAVSRTFGRIRMMRKIMIPMVFMGGFLTAVIFSIKMIGFVNMLLIGKVLLLQVAIVLGKIIYGAKDLFLHKHQPVAYPVYSPPTYYPPVTSHHPWSGHESHSSGFASAFANSRDDFTDLQPSYSSNFIRYSQPQFRSNIIQPQTGLRTQTNSGQPQSGSFSGILMQAPQQVRAPQRSQFGQPFNHAEAQHINEAIVEPFDDQSFNRNEIIVGDAPQAQALVQQVPSITAHKPSMTPQEMQKMLSDAIAQMSAKASQQTIRQRSLNGGS